MNACHIIPTTPFLPPQVPIIQYLQENHFLEAKDHLPSYILSTILVQHYVYFRIALKWYIACKLVIVFIN